MVAQCNSAKVIFWQASASIAHKLPSRLTQKGQKAVSEGPKCPRPLRDPYANSGFVLYGGRLALLQFGEPLGEQAFELDQRG